ncbi:MAG: hypothetical protein WAL50_04215 [Kineosporiaceae bacterium]
MTPRQRATRAGLDQRLRGGDPRSLGQANEIVGEVLSAPDRLAELVECVLGDDPVVRMRASDALEKVARQRPAWVEPFLDRLLGPVSTIEQASVQWHLAQILGEVPLDVPRRRLAVRLLRTFLEHSTDWIVLTSTMESLTTLATGDARLRRWLIPVLQHHLDDRRPAVVKRAARQLARLGS